MMSMCWVKLKMVWITSSFWLVAGKSLRTIKLRYILWWTPIDYTTLVIYICISLGLSKVIDYTTSSKTKKASWAPQIISQDKILATFMTSPCIVGYSCGFHILLQISTTPPPISECFTMCVTLTTLSRGIEISHAKTWSKCWMTARHVITHLEA